MAESTGGATLFEFARPRRLCWLSTNRVAVLLGVLLVSALGACSSTDDRAPGFEPWVNAPGFFRAVGEPLVEPLAGGTWAVFSEDTESWRVANPPSDPPRAWWVQVELDELSVASLPERYSGSSPVQPDCDVSPGFVVSPIAEGMGLYICLDEVGSGIEAVVMNLGTDVVPMLVDSGVEAEGVGRVSQALSDLHDGGLFLLAAGEQARWLLPNDQSAPLIRSTPSWAAGFGTVIQILVDGIGVDSDGVPELLRCFSGKLAVFDQIGAGIADVSVFSGFATGCGLDVAAATRNHHIEDATQAFVEWFELEAVGSPAYEIWKEIWPEVLLDFDLSA